MENCSSSFNLQQTVQFASERCELPHNRSCLLPPRKRLLANLKERRDIPKLEICPPSSTCRVEGGDFEPKKKALAAAITRTSCKLTEPSSSLHEKSLMDLCSMKCCDCGDSGVLLHRISAGHGSYRCSTCILASNKHMYCFLCSQVITENILSPSSLSTLSFISCCICQRYGHLDCGRKVWPSSALDRSDLILCDECIAKDGIDSPPERMKKKTINSMSKQKRKTPMIDQEVLIAARIVAALAQKEAYMAKARAIDMARVAASAAIRAKVALDNAYDLNHMKREEEGEAEITMSDEQERSISKTRSGLKKRALSSIVASEILCNESNASYEATVKSVKRRKWKCSLDHMASSPHPVMKNQDIASSAKRRKYVSSIQTCSVVKYQGSKVTNSKSKSSRKTVKGKLGSLFSEAFAIGKGEKTLSDIP